MRSIIFALAALAFATSVSAANSTATGGSKVAAGPYKLDAAGKCRAANGQFVTRNYCATPAAARKQQCRNPKTGKFVKCGTPGSVPS